MDRTGVGRPFARRTREWNIRKAPRARHAARVARTGALLVLLLLAALVGSCRKAESPGVLHAAIMAGDLAVVRGILTEHPEWIESKGYRGFTVLHTAAFYGHERIVELLLQNGADPNARADNDITPLLNACAVGSQPIVELLVRHGANVNHQTKAGTSPLYVAAVGGYRHIVEFLLDKDAQVDPFAAAALGKTKELSSMLDSDPDLLRATTEGGITLLHAAARACQEEAARLLIQRGADVTCRTEHELLTPLHFAALSGCVAVAEALLEAGADINAQDWLGQTALHFACEKDHSEMAKALVRAGANVNAIDREGLTPLHVACINGDIGLVQLLVDAGADINMYSPQEGTALDCAVLTGHKDIVDLLRKRTRESQPLRPDTEPD